MIISIFEKKKYVILLALFLKDLKLWAFANVITLTIPILFIVTIYFVITRYFDVFEMTECAYLIARIGVFMPLFYGEFILEREFKNGTYIFMRTVPISDRFLHLEKIIFSFIMVAISKIPALMIIPTMIHVESKRFNSRRGCAKPVDTSANSTVLFDIEALF